MSRIPLLAGNWKMHKTQREALDLVEGLLEARGWERDREVLVCPPFTALYVVAQRLHNTSLKLGCQNVHWETRGALTGEVSPVMARDAKCDYVIIGHSERRQHFGETDANCHRKVAAVLEHGMRPILCCGETLEERENGQTREKVATQVRAALHNIHVSDGNDLVIAYEPIWAIGTGKNDTPEEANKTIAMIRGLLAEQFGEGMARRLRILYGGSVKPDNIDGFMSQPDIDGALVGGASLEAESFLRIVHFNAVLT
ncbi:MAG: triose-phosphate isomerase [Armatimonadetes bacterium]|nr:triose-phosphate isomerase [Armatimonadota bacterium]